MEDERFSHESHFEAMDTIDCLLFSGCPKNDELDAIEEFMERWKAQIAQWRKFHEECEEEEST